MSNKTPPCAYLKIIAAQCQKALGTYLQLWEMMDQDCMVYAPWDQINELFLTSRAKFKHDLIVLASSMLISYEFLNDKFIINIVGWDGEPV